MGETGHGSLYRVVTDPPSGTKIQFPSILGPLTSETASVRFRQNPAVYPVSICLLISFIPEPRISGSNADSARELELALSSKKHAMSLVNEGSQGRRCRGRFPKILPRSQHARGRVSRRNTAIVSTQMSQIAREPRALPIRVCRWPIDPSKPIPAAFSVLRSYKPKRTRHVLSFSARHPVTGEPNPERLRRYNDDLHF